MRSVKLEEFRETLNKQLVESYPNYKINEYFNTECCSISWLRVVEVADNAISTIAAITQLKSMNKRRNRNET